MITQGYDITISASYYGFSYNIFITARTSKNKVDDYDTIRGTK